ncbi:ScyD/ScyE family protein [Nocardioides alcanivorans]|uniref:ScyD/ScyE family protein n=1 Tax=Nocardioides alcanivorans TaxID=2897352 RepID=UPI001F44839B|nr:ScyD/ScyE family protein [Nocardioides alcanivorans]
MSRTVQLLASASSLALGATLAAVLTSPPGAAAPQQGGRGGDRPAWTEVASGLDNPRLLSFDGTKLYVAESGTGGAGPCFEGPEGEACFGTTGAITEISHRGQRRVVTGLPSLAGPDGSSAGGPADVLVQHGRWTITVGLGADPAVRATLPSQLFGTLLTGQLGRKGNRVIADLAAHEAATDPDGVGPDSNPTGLALSPGHAWHKRGKHGHKHGKLGKHARKHHSKHGRHHRRASIVTTDSGGNSLLAVSQSGRVRTLAVFDSPGTAPMPFPPFDEVPMQSVPTSVVRGPDGAWYVSELTGFPFAPGTSRIHRVTADGRSKVWATGLTNVTDLAWHRGVLYAVQLSDAGLLNEEGLPMGSLVRVAPRGAHRTVVGNLPAPYGVAMSGRSAYLTTCSVCAGGGAVVKVQLP